MHGRKGQSNIISTKSKHNAKSMDPCPQGPWLHAWLGCRLADFNTLDARPDGSFDYMIVERVLSLSLNPRPAAFLECPVWKSVCGLDLLGAQALARPRRAARNGSRSDI